ncbi:hypothetical protein DFH28DRAFT_924516 [Melampsora americana]|nr:hypothetical protein DFH28DRAFT_924516 [Melampsora americana]
MKLITYIFFLGAQFSLYGHVMSQGDPTGFLCDNPGPNIVSFGVCATDNQKPKDNQPLIASLTNATNAELTKANKFGKYGQWSCDSIKLTVSYCCKTSADLKKKTAAGCRRQISSPRTGD